MNILAQQYTSKRFDSSLQESSCKRAMEMKTVYEQIAHDLTTHDNLSGIDFNRKDNQVELKGATVTNSDAKYQESGPDCKSSENLALGAETRAFGTANLNGPLPEFHLEGLDGMFDAKVSHGTFGLGQERLVLTSQRDQDCDQDIAVFFADGTITFENRYPSV